MPKMSSLTDASLFLAQQTAPGPQASLMSFLPIILLFAAMYFLMIAPQRKKQKEHDKMLKALVTGDEVVTSGGIYGQITNVKEDRFVIRVAENAKIEVGKTFVAALVRKSGEEKK